MWRQSVIYMRTHGVERFTEMGETSLLLDMVKNICSSRNLRFNGTEVYNKEYFLMDYLSFLLPLVLPQLYQTGGSSHYLLSADLRTISWVL